MVLPRLSHDREVEIARKYAYNDAVSPDIAALITELSCLNSELDVARTLIAAFGAAKTAKEAGKLRKKANAFFGDNKTMRAWYRAAIGRLDMLLEVKTTPASDPNRTSW